MAAIGTRALLPVTREKPFGVMLDAGELGEVLLPRNELGGGSPRPGEPLDVFLYLDSEDRPIATLRAPKAMPGEFAKLEVLAVNAVGAFLDWGLPKDLLLPFREQSGRVEPGKRVLVRLLVDEASGRILASMRISRFLDPDPSGLEPGQAVDLIVHARTPLGYKAIVDGRWEGLIFGNEVFGGLSRGQSIRGYVADLRPDGKVDLSLQPPGRDRVDLLADQILEELTARGGYWPIGDHSPAEEIHDELGVSKRVFKQATGTLFRRRLITISDDGLRLAADA